MDSANNGRVTVDELAMLLGSKDIEIFSLQKQLNACRAELEEIEKKNKAAE